MGTMGRDFGRYVVVDKGGNVSRGFVLDRISWAPSAFSFSASKDGISFLILTFDSFSRN